MAIIPDSHWEWSPICCDIEFRQIDSNFSGGILFKQLQKSQSLNSIFDEYSLTMSKYLLYSEIKGWYWHKNWNVPTIWIKLIKKDYFHVKESYVGLYIVKKISNTDFLEDLSLQGQNVLKLNDKIKEKVKFSSLKIKTTSYFHNHQKFHFLINFFTKDENSRTSLFSLLSTPFSVDSRESPRNNSCAKQRAPFLEPFLPCLLMKKLIKKRSKQEINEIENSLEGLSQYLSAANLKFKVKHPLFLLLKFSNVFALYIKSPSDELKENIVIDLQKYIYTNYSNSFGKNNEKLSKTKDFMLLFKNNKNLTYNIKHQKVNELVQVLNKKLIDVVLNLEEIPKEYKEYKNLKILKKWYEKTYPFLNSEKISPLYALNFDGDKEKSLIGKDSFNIKDQNLTKKLKSEENVNGYLRKRLDSRKMTLFREINEKYNEKSSIKLITTIDSFFLRKDEFPNKYLKNTDKISFEKEKNDPKKSDLTINVRKTMENFFLFRFVNSSFNFQNQFMHYST